MTAANKAIEAGGRLRDRAVDFALEVRDNMAQREAELGDALGLNAPVDRGLPAPRHHAVIENRNSPKYVAGPEAGPTYRTYPYNRNEDH
ncbi:Secreted protein OS=Streptomyces griseomycini OX=66895 GN=FHS37_004667 PE=4 SV=1 [Streptomyces griseomycini]